MKVLIDSEAIQRRVAELGTQISRDYEGKEVAVVGSSRGRSSSWGT